MAGGGGGRETEDMEGCQVVGHLVLGVKVLLGVLGAGLVATVLGWFLEGGWGLEGEECCPKQGRHPMAPTSPLASSLRFAGLGLSHLSVAHHSPLHVVQSPPLSFSATSPPHPHVSSKSPPPPCSSSTLHPPPLFSIAPPLPPLFPVSTHPPGFFSASTPLPDFFSSTPPHPPPFFSTPPPPPFPFSSTPLPDRSPAPANTLP